MTANAVKVVLRERFLQMYHTRVTRRSASVMKARGPTIGEISYAHAPIEIRNHSRRYLIL